MKKVIHFTALGQWRLESSCKNEENKPFRFFSERYKSRYSKYSQKTSKKAKMVKFEYLTYFLATITLKIDKNNKLRWENFFLWLWYPKRAKNRQKQPKKPFSSSCAILAISGWKIIHEKYKKTKHKVHKIFSVALVPKKSQKSPKKAKKCNFHHYGPF